MLTASGGAPVVFHVRIEALIILSLLFIKMLPEALLVVPFYGLIADVGMLNSHISLIAVYCSFALPFAVWISNRLTRPRSHRS